MANNPNVNKVVYDGNTLIDITDTTAVEEDVDTGKVFYKASGARSVGTGSSGSGKMDLVTNPTAGNVLITDGNGQAQDAGVEPIYYETVASGANAVLVGIDMDLLWENADPTSAFTAQTISLDLSGYQSVIIKFILDNAYSSYSNVVTYTLGMVDTYSGIVLMSLTTSGSSREHYRQYTISSSGVAFLGGYRSSDARNSVFVPIEIYGIR